jgi:hypothetical protein
MRVITINLFTFEELTQEGQARAIENERTRREKTGESRPWEYEDSKSIEKIAGILETSPIYYNDFEGFNTGYIDEEILNLKDNRALSYIYNHYYPTKLKFIWKGNKSRQSKCTHVFDGEYYMDFTLADAVEKFKGEMKAGSHPTIENFIEMVGDIIRQYIEIDEDFWWSDEGIQEDIIANYDGPVFWANGDIFAHDVTPA